MNVLLDENFPLGLVRVLEADGLRVDHIITLGWRGASDARIRQRLADRERPLMATVPFPPRRSRREKQTPNYVHQFLVVLCGTDPLVWRRIQVPPGYSFWDLHVALQDAMGWEDRHLHEFRFFDDAAHQTIAIGIPTDMSSADHPVAPGWTVPLSKYFEPRSGQRLPLIYLYDFGDGWEHIVIHEGLEPIKPAQKYPRCLAGERRCPPEDCGGVHGYAEFLKAVANPKHPRHAELTEWIGRAWAADDFEPRRVVFDDPQKRWAGAFQR